MAAFRLVVLILSVVAGTLAKDYTGYKVYEVTPQSKDQLDLLRNISSEDVSFDFFSEPVAIGRPLLVMVPPVMERRFQGLVTHHHISTILFLDNVQREIDAEKSRLSQRYHNAEGFAFDIDDFNTFDDILAQLEVWTGQCPSGFRCVLKTIGTSYEERPIRLMSITKAGAGRRQIWLDATIHAREWLCTATLLKMLDNLITNYGSDSDATYLLDTYDFHILPVVNPDGYTQSWGSNRLQRKNMAPNPGSTCRGTDLNRNYDWNWGTQGISHNPCSDIYCGGEAASELETQAVVRELTALTETASFLTLFSFHTFGRYTLFPWATSTSGRCDRSDDYDDLYDVGMAFTTTIEDVGGQNWLCGTVCEVLYEAAGSTIDWSKGELGIKYTYTPELRGSFFIVDKAEIPRSYSEVWQGFVAAVSVIESIG